MATIRSRIKLTALNPSMVLEKKWLKSNDSLTRLEKS